MYFMNLMYRYRNLLFLYELRYGCLKIAIFNAIIALFFISGACAQICILGEFGRFASFCYLHRYMSLRQI
jgi:hypothetical protein